MLRLLTVISFAGVGYEVARAIEPSGGVLGPFNGVTVGVIVGSGIGYVVGGVVGRSAVVAADRTEVALRTVSADTVVAGAIGLLLGVLFGAGVAWPLFLIPQPLIGVPLFGFVVAILGYVGFHVGVSKRDGVLELFGARAGLAPRQVPNAAVPRVVDSSVAIDGRVLDVVRAGFLHGQLLLLEPVIAELQGLADAGDDARRAKGRRGLDTLEALRREAGVEVVPIRDEHQEIPEVDAKLVRTCLDRDAALLTLDTNLAKAAALAGARVLNLHALSLALRPPVVAGDDVTVQLIKPGREPGQAIGYLDDGTMVVVERARTAVGTEMTVQVSSVLTTANGRMVFAQPVQPVQPGLAAGPGRQPRP
ncbi:MAG TPA: hypothetical protein VNE21_05280 [Mycobacteriales bacterium]|nr:hypothetical protein [Mycobacteriales bacterium]